MGWQRVLVEGTRARVACDQFASSNPSMCAAAHILPTNPRPDAQVFDAVRSDTGEQCSVFYFSKDQISLLSNTERELVLKRLRCGIEISRR